MNLIEFLTTVVIVVLLFGGLIVCVAVTSLYILKPELFHRRPLPKQQTQTQTQTQTKQTKDSFQNIPGVSSPGGVYQNWDRQVNYLKDVHNIGKAPGVVQVYPNQSGTCGANSNQNLIVQPNVAFRSYRQGDGCTYVDLRWPNA